VNALAARHPALRTRYLETDGRAGQTIASPGPVHIERVKLPGPDTSIPAQAQAALLAQTNHVFDLAQGPFRVTLIELEPEDHYLALTIHQLSADGWSLDLVQRDLAELYNAFVEQRPAQLAPLAIDYTDFAIWQNSEPMLEERRRHNRYWVETLAGAPVELGFPFDFARPSQPSHHAWVREICLSEGLLARLGSIAREQGVTTFALFAAAWAMLLRQHGCGDDIVMGSFFAARDRSEFEPVVGLFSNLLPIRIQLDSEVTFAGLAARVQKTVLATMEHQDAAMDEVVEALRLPHVPGVVPLFQTSFHHITLPIDDLPLRDLQPRRLPFLPPRTHFDMMFSAYELAFGFLGWICLRSQLFRESTADRIATELTGLFEEAAADPSRALSRF
jgi:Condensation domain